VGIRDHLRDPEYDMKHSVMHKLRQQGLIVIEANYNTRTAPDAHAIMRSDIEWAKEK
jgi:hypothetical protein